LVEARAPDGTVEAVRVADAKSFAFGVQWHPEYWASSHAPSGALFRAFGDAARERARRGLPLAAE
jgi:putative glutamine amidotransferase